MQIKIKVKTNARKNQVEKSSDGSLLVFVTASPVDGKANEQVIKLLAKYFSVAASLIEIVSGATTKQKNIVIYTL